MVWHDGTWVRQPISRWFNQTKLGVVSKDELSRGDLGVEESEVCLLKGELIERGSGGLA